MFPSVSFGPVESFLRQTFPIFGVLQKALKLASQLVRGTGLHHHDLPAVFDEALETGVGGGQDGQPGAHGFQERKGKPFVKGGKHKEIMLR